MYEKVQPLLRRAQSALLRRPPPKVAAAMKKKRKGHATMGSTVATSDVILQSFWVTPAGPNNGQKRVRVFLDGGAHYSYVTQKLAKDLGLQQNGVEHQSVAVFRGGPRD